MVDEDYKPETMIIERNMQIIEAANAVLNKLNKDTEDETIVTVDERIQGLKRELDTIEYMMQLSKDTCNMEKRKHEIEEMIESLEKEEDVF
jgi:predicted ester cyclase